MKKLTSCFRRQKTPTPKPSVVEPSTPEVPVIENVSIPEIQNPIEEVSISEFQSSIQAPSTFVSCFSIFKNMLGFPEDRMSDCH